MLQFELITPEKVAISEEVYELILPSEKGQIAILPGHMPLITILRPGVISVRRQKTDSDEKMDHLATSGGFVEIGNNVVKVMVDTAERAEDLDELKIEAARTEAIRMTHEARDDVSHADAVARLETELARSKVRNIRKRHSSHSPHPDTIV